MGLEMFFMVLASSMVLVYGMVLMDKLLYETVIEMNSMDEKMGQAVEAGEDVIWLFHSIL